MIIVTIFLYALLLGRLKCKTSVLKFTFSNSRPRVVNNKLYVYQSQSNNNTRLCCTHNEMRTHYYDCGKNWIV